MFFTAAVVSVCMGGVCVFWEYRTRNVAKHAMQNALQRARSMMEDKEEEIEEEV